MKSLLYKAGAGAAILLLTYCLGQTHGRNEGERQRAEEARSAAAEVIRLQGINTALTNQHALELGKVTRELQLSQDEHRQTLADSRNRFAQRLRSAEDRAVGYQRLSEASAAERTYLASHAAELDRSLEEGRQLVFELRQTLGLCEVRVSTLAQTIRADRALFEGPQ